MKDAERNKLVEDFANESSIAKGGHIKVTYGDHCTSFQPAPEYTGFKFEDGQYLERLIDGASAFVFWLSRSGLTISKKRKRK